MNVSLLRGIYEEGIHVTVFRKQGTNCPQKNTFLHMHKVPFFFQINWMFGLKFCHKLAHLGMTVAQGFSAAIASGPPRKKYEFFFNSHFVFFCLNGP
jgi:hypothetical protein